MHTLVDVAATLFQILALFLASTVAFDVVHVLLHRFERSRFATLRALGGLHAVHHRFADRDLAIHGELTADNIRWHVIPEYGTQLAFGLCLLPVLPARVVLGAVLLQTLVFVLILRARGMDVNHRPIAVLRAHRPSVFCLPRYHALHHAFPTAHFSSWIKLLDCALGTGMALDGRRVAATPGGLAGALRRQATALGAVSCDGFDQAVEAVVDEQATPRLADVPAADREDAGRARAAARRVLQDIRRGFHFVSTRNPARGLVGRLQFRRAARLSRAAAPA